MQATLMTTGMVASPFKNSDGEINVKGLCKAIQIERARLPGIVGLTKQAIAHYFEQGVDFVRLRNQESLDFFQKLNKVYILVRAIQGKKISEEKIRAWFHAPNRALEMKSPVELVYERNLDALIEKLMDVITAAHGG